MTPDVIGSKILLALKAKDLKAAHEAFKEFKQGVANPETSHLFGNWITEPLYNKPIYDELLANGIPPRATAIRRGNYTRLSRGYMMVHAMETAVGRSIK